MLIGREDYSDVQVVCTDRVSSARLQSVCLASIVRTVQENKLGQLSCPETELICPMTQKDVLKGLEPPRRQPLCPEL